VQAAVYAWHDHTSEVELVIEAESEEAVFGEALAGLAELLGEARDGSPASRPVAATARDRAALLADWLGELVALAEIESFLPQRIRALELGPDGVVSTIEGTEGDPRPLVKAVTYHRLRFEPVEDGGWRARVVFDV
jgi:SHS2 domain-containing protein